MPCGSDVLTLFQSPVEKKSYFANQSSLHLVFPVPNECSFPFCLSSLPPSPHRRRPPVYLASSRRTAEVARSDDRILVASLIPEPLPQGGGARHGSLLGVAAASLRLSHLVTDERGIQINARGRRSSDPRPRSLSLSPSAASPLQCRRLPPSIPDSALPQGRPKTFLLSGKRVIPADMTRRPRGVAGRSPAESFSSCVSD